MFLKRITTLLFFIAFSPLGVSGTLSPSDFSPSATYWDAKISPDGKYLAIGLDTNSKKSIAVLNAKTFKPVGGVKFPDRKEVGEFIWANNERMVIKMVERLPWQEESSYFGELYAVDFDGGNGEMIFGVRVGGMQTGSRIKSKKSTRGWAEIINVLKNDEKHILISSTPMTEGGGSLANVHKLNIYNGQLGPQLKRSPVPYSDFVADEDGNLKLVVGMNSSYEREVYIIDKESGEWKAINDTAYGRTFTPLALNEDGEMLYVLDNFGNDKVGLHKLDLMTGELSEVYTDEKVDVTSPLYTADKTSVFGLRLDPGRPEYVMFNDNSDEAQVFKDLVASFPGSVVSLRSHSKDGNLWTVYVHSDIDLGSFYLYNKASNQLVFLFKNFEHINSKDLAQSKPISFDATDGTTVYGYITYPNNLQDKEKVPMVTLVHGGPRERDYWTFNREVQVLASQGYAVLRVNFRGSEGYGVRHTDKGNKQWGNKIQQDIIDGTRWAIEQGQIDKNKVCIMGTSFGGYSAVQAPIVEPDLFKCAVANAGPYDLEMLFEEGDIPKALYGKSYLENAIGNDKEQLRRYSPAHNLDKLTIPVFITHGAKDVRVPVEHAELLKEGLDKLDKPYKWFIEDRETHGFHNEENRIKYYDRVTSFLAKYLQ